MLGCQGKKGRMESMERKEEDIRRIFEILGIGVTKDEEGIRAAYRGKLVSVNPEDNPEGFKRLREAYENALDYARQEEEGTGEPDGPVGLFLQEVGEVYHSLPKRLDGAEWERLLQKDLMDDLELGEETKWAFFRYLSEYFRLPVYIWRILDRIFGIVEHQEEFKEHLPENFVYYMAGKCGEGAEKSDFPYEKLKGPDHADYDAFIQNYAALTGITGEDGEEGDGWLKEMGQKIALMDTLGISHPWSGMEKARYALFCGREEDAERMVRELWEDGENEDRRMLLAGTYIIRKCGKEEEAAGIYRELLEKGDLEDNDAYSIHIALAELCAAKKEWRDAKEHAQDAGRIYNTQKAAELLQEYNERVIALYDGERAGQITEEEGVQLAWCYVQNDRAAEGLEFFKEHPVLDADKADCHRAKAVLYMAGECAEEAGKEAILWRQCMEKEGEESPYRMAQSHEWEGNALRQRYLKAVEQETESESGQESERESEQWKAQTLAAYEEAIAIQPEEIDFRMAKLMFLRDFKDYGQMLETCEKIKELDRGYFWAYFYAQEAYEGLGKAQEVVDTFYEAKEIYAGMPEIFERAVRVFYEYGQFGEVRSILDQAQEAEVESPYLKLRRLDLMRRAAEDETALREADAYAGNLIRELEEEAEKSGGENLSPQLKKILSEAYLQRAYIHDEPDAGEFCLEEEMEQWTKRAVELDDNLRNRYFLGRYYVEYGEDAKPAYEHLKVCEERGMDYEWMYYYMARSLEDFERWDEATEYYVKAHEKNPEEFDFIWRIVWRYRWKYSWSGQKEYYDKAMEYLNLHLEKFGENPRELWQLSDLHARNHEYGLALEEIERALKEATQSRNWGHKAFLLEMLNRRDEAVAYYRKGLAAGWEKGEDYNYAHSQMHDYFCETRQYRKGLEWFLEMDGQLKTEERRRKNLGYIRYYYMRFREWEQALNNIVQLYGGTSLTEYVCDNWEKEGARIDDLLDLYQKFLSGDELRQKAEEAQELLEGKGAGKLKEDHDGKASAYMQIAYCYADFLMEQEKAAVFFQKSIEHRKLAEKGIDSGDYRTALMELMQCYWRLGNLDGARECKERYLESQGEFYKECKDLGRSVEELFAGDCSNGRGHAYHLFLMHYYCGEYEEAGKYLERMEKSPWCWNCTRKECTEEWELKGYMALYRGRTQEAVGYFRRAVETSSRGNEDAEKELRILGVEI